MSQLNTTKHPAARPVTPAPYGRNSRPAAFGAEFPAPVYLAAAFALPGIHALRQLFLFNLSPHEIQLQPSVLHKPDQIGVQRPGPVPELDQPEHLPAVGIVNGPVPREQGNLLPVMDHQAVRKGHDHRTGRSGRGVCRQRSRKPRLQFPAVGSPEGKTPATALCPHFFLSYIFRTTGNRAI